jgi:Flp pilus assembly protein TadG
MRGIAKNSMLADAPKVQRQPFLRACKSTLSRQRGAIAIMTALLLPLLIGFLALAFELGQAYNRKAEMQSIADAIAIAAAKKLNGSSSGIDDALDAARDVVESGDATTTRPRYRYGKMMTFSDAAIQFGNASDGGQTGWMPAQAAKVSPVKIAYVKVDTNSLNSDYGKIEFIFVQALGKFKPLYMSHTTIAGKQHIKLMPFAICSMSRDATQPFQPRVTPEGYSELTEYGFRRGISYNIMKLSPNTASGVSYLVDPINLPPKGGNFTSSTVAPYMCAGTVEYQKVIGKKLNLQSDFSFSQFIGHLNSRFDLANGPCSAVAAPPDSNTKQFTYSTNNWMTSPGRQVAKQLISSSRMETVADAIPPAAQASGSYGPLWTFAQAVPWSSYKPEEPEPAKGYVPFQATSVVWNSLYATVPGLSSYPTDSKTSAYSPPYFSQSGAVPATNYPGVQGRRVLNVPLLECPAPGDPGVVVAIAKFFMTVQADANGIYAEFAGVTLQEEMANTVELIQ